MASGSKRWFSIVTSPISSRVPSNEAVSPSSSAFATDNSLTTKTLPVSIAALPVWPVGSGVGFHESWPTCRSTGVNVIWF